MGQVVICDKLISRKASLSENALYVNFCTDCAIIFVFGRLFFYNICFCNILLVSLLITKLCCYCTVAKVLLVSLFCALSFPVKLIACTTLHCKSDGSVLIGEFQVCYQQ